MFGKARQLETVAELYDVAVRALMRRAHSVHEMKEKLERRSNNKLLVQLVMARLKENGQIDDARYAKQFARQRTAGRKQGKFRVARELRVRGVPDRHIESALEEAGKETDEGATVRQRIERKLRSYRGYGSLLGAGFSADVVRRELKAIVKEDVPEADLEYFSNLGLLDTHPAVYVSGKHKEIIRGNVPIKISPGTDKAPKWRATS